MAEVLTSATHLKHIPLANGVLIPRLGLGTFRARDEDVRKAVQCALQCGYNHIGKRPAISFAFVFLRLLSFLPQICCDQFAFLCF